MCLELKHLLVGERSTGAFWYKLKYSISHSCGIPVSGISVRYRSIPVPPDWILLFQYQTGSGIGIFIHSGTRLTRCQTVWQPKNTLQRWKMLHTPCTSTPQVMDLDTPWTFKLLVVERRTPCMSTLLVIERDTPWRSILLAPERDTSWK